MSDSPPPVRAWLSDMDGVLVHEEEAIPGAADFVRRLRDRGEHVHPRPAVRQNGGEHDLAGVVQRGR